MTTEETLRALFVRMVVQGLISVFVTESGPPGTPPGALFTAKAGKLALTKSEVEALSND